MQTFYPLKVAVIDGQGGGIGKALVERLCREFPKDIEIYGLGTNTLATSALLKAGAHISATGENAIVYNASKVDVIMGSVGIISANSMHGELTPKMATAISDNDAVKILIPLNRCSILIAGSQAGSVASYIDDSIVLLGQIIEKGVTCS